MFYYYYFLREVNGTGTKIYQTENWIGDIGDRIFLAADKRSYVIEDYTEEWLDLEEPEDY